MNRKSRFIRRVEEARLATAEAKGFFERYVNISTEVSPFETALQQVIDLLACVEKHWGSTVDLTTAIQDAQKMMRVVDSLEEVLIDDPD